MENSGVIKKKNRSIYVVIVGIVLGLIAAVLMYMGISSYTGMVKVVAASKEIPAFTVINEADIKLIDVPKEFAKNKASDKNLVIGRVSRTIIPADTAVQQEFLAEKGNSSSSLLSTKLSDLQNEKLRAFTIPVDQISGCGGEMKPGDLVDIIGSFSIVIPENENQPQSQSQSSSKSQQKEVISKLLAGQVLVLKTLGEKTEIEGIVVAVEPQQAQEIQFALQAGKISVALNPYNPDQEASKTTTTTVQSFIKKYANDILN